MNKYEDYTPNVLLWAFIEGEIDDTEEFKKQMKQFIADGYQMRNLDKAKGSLEGFSFGLKASGINNAEFIVENVADLITQYSK